MALHHLLNRTLRTGDLRVVYADGSRHSYGNGSGRPMGVRTADRTAEKPLLLNPKLALGEAYVDGQLVLEEGSLHDLLAVAADNVGNLEPDLAGDFGMDLWRAATSLWSDNHVKRARANVAHHYDL